MVTTSKLGENLTAFTGIGFTKGFGGGVRFGRDTTT